MKNKNKVLTLVLFVCGNLCAQISNSTFSPYSLFGVGRFFDANTGVTNSLGRSGIGLSSEYEINGLNPASLGAAKNKTFILDIGGKNEYMTFGDRTETDYRKTLLNFSNISFAFPLNKKSAVSVSLLPFSEVGYYFQGIVSDVEGSQLQHISIISGDGGLSNINLNYGIKINSKLNLGTSLKYFFGTINQNETILLDNDYLTIDDQNYYRGLNLGLGMQYQLSKRFSVSSVVNLPSRLSGSKDRIVNKYIDNLETNVSTSKGVKIDDYKIPLDATIGFKYDYKHFTFITDYKRTFWDMTDMEDNIGNYTDSNMFGCGVEYYDKKDIYHIRKARFRYRIGYNFDDGSLKVNNKKISSNFITVGIGIPIGTDLNSYLNVSYSYGVKGVVSNTLIQEKFHTVTFNINLKDTWFQRRKYE